VITAVITKESAEKLGLAEGDDVCAIIKSTEVIVGK
jgi:molybdopterin-binding protein